MEPFLIEAVHIALFHLHFPGVRPDCSITDASVIICSSLLAIWRSHWAYIFDSVLFISSTTIASATHLIQQYLKEALYNQGISPLLLVITNISLSQSKHPISTKQNLKKTITRDLIILS
ncbi:uncharacterized protein B0P05DRAFT_124846, partial [Gilbertella persicaria]|uniref:uncharacterized protein n=1 Tax=Gilbertella persicaria TaxID=101096 RepID=UPI00221F8AC6